MTRGALAALLAVGVAATVARGEVAAPETTEVFVGQATPAVSHALAHRFLIDGSETVRRGGEELARDADYRLDPDAGTITLRPPLREGERLEISYSWIPVELPREVVAVRPAEPTPADSAAMARPEPTTAELLARSIDQDLTIRGAKTVSIETGTNKDAAVEQSLRVSVTGRVGDDVRISALLSDQNIPLQPEGNTERLENLDEVLVKIEGPRGSATLGDFPARRQGTAFGNFERRLSGAEARANARGLRARGIGASSRGNFRTVEFRGEEGKQGPYVLAGDGANPTGVIVAGSERVWLDGRSLRRGRNQDYVIDYTVGTLEFTNRTLVTQDSRIAVDFEVAEQPYRRSLLLGEGGAGETGAPLEWRTAVIAEIDDQDPLTFTLTDERREALEQAGDGPVLVSGAVCGVEDGDYVEEDDHFVWVGADSGTCDVSFVFVGEGQGDYVRDRDSDTGALFFRFVGPTLGSYTPGLLLTAPRSHTLADTRLAARGKGLTFTADLGYSREDRNTLSTLSAADEGAAGQAGLAWESPVLGDLGGPLRLSATTRFRGEQEEFVALGRNRTPWLGEVWNFTDTTKADEGLGEASVQLAGGERWNVGGAFGRLDRTGIFRSTRREGSARWTGGFVPMARYRIESVTREDRADSLGPVNGDLDRQRGELRLQAGWLGPGATYYRERREDARGTERLSGRDEEEWAGTLALTPGSSFRADFRLAERTTDVVDSSAWVRDNVGRTYEVRGELSPRRALRARVSWIRRQVDRAAGRGQDSRSDLTRADLTHENLGGQLRGEYVYETTSRTFSSLLADPDAPAVPSLALDASGRIRIGGRSRGDSPGGLARWLSRFEAETLLRVEEETTRTDRAPIYLLDLSEFQSDEHTVFGRIQARQEITLFPGAGPFQLTGRWERIDTEDNRGAPRKLDILSERWVLRARNRLRARWTLESQGTVQDDVRSDQGLQEFDLRLLLLEGDLVYQPRPATRVSAGGALADERNDTTGASIRGVTARTALSTSVRTNGRFRAEASWTRPTDIVGTDVGNRFRTRETDQIDWQGALDYRLNEWINVSVTYSGRAREGLPTTHLARAEARALF